MALRYVGPETVLLVSFHDGPSASTRELLALKEAGRFHEQAIFAVHIDLLHGVEAVVDLLRNETEIRSAAFLPGMPIAESLWVAMEWWGRVVVHQSLADQFLDRLDLPGVNIESAGDEFIVLDPRRRPPDRPERAKRADPDLEQLQDELAALYGDLHHPDLGGAVALASIFGQMPSDLESAGIAVERDPSAVPALVAAGVIQMAAVGGSVSSWRAMADRWPDATPIAEVDPTEHASAAPYLVLARLSAHVDPPVRFPPGFILEQEQLNNVQNLAIADEIVVGVQPGLPVLAVLPAYCLNRHLAPPRGEPLRATALRMQLPANTTQERVWDELAWRRGAG